MPGGDNVLVHLRWDEEGAQIPARARESLMGVANAGRAVTATTAAAVPAVTQFSTATETAGHAAEGHARGIHMMRSAMMGLAFQATQTGGPTGHLASGLLLFGGGSTLVLGVAAGLALIAGGLHLVTQELHDATQAHEGFVKQLTQIATGKVPAQAALNDANLALSNARDALAALQERAAAFGTGKAGVGSAISGRVDPKALEAARSALQAAQAVVDQLTNAAQQEHVHAGEKTADQFLEGFRRRFQTANAPELFALMKELQQRIQEGGRLAAEKFGPLLNEIVNQLIAVVTRLPTRITSAFMRVRTRADVAEGQAPFTVPAPMVLPGQRPSFAAFGQGGAGTSFQDTLRTAQLTEEQKRYGAAVDFTRGVLQRALTPQQIFNLGVENLQIAFDQGAITTEQFRSGVAQLTEDMEKATKKTSILAVSIINAVSGAIAGVVSGGSAGGVLSAIGGIVGLLPGGQIAGAALGGLGAIISAAGSNGVNINSYSPQALAQLRGIPNTPQRVSLTVVSATTGEIIDRVIFELGQRQISDGVKRVPGLIYQGT